MTSQTQREVALVIISTISVSGSVVCAQDNFRMLGEKEIRARVVGKNITDRAHWSMYLRPDGVLIRAGMSIREPGTWKIQNNKLCMSDPSNKLLNCSYVWMTGERIILRMKEKADADDFDAFVDKH